MASKPAPTRTASFSLDEIKYKKKLKELRRKVRDIEEVSKCEPTHPLLLPTGSRAQDGEGGMAILVREREREEKRELTPSKLTSLIYCSSFPVGE